MARSIILGVEQVEAIALATTKLKAKSDNPDDQVHVTQQEDGTGAIRVELTSVTKCFYVSTEGELFETWQELSDRLDGK
jgi:hypothetical protein